MLGAMVQTELKRQLSLFDAIMLIAGDMIGIGIFVTTGAIAETLPSPGGVLLVIGYFVCGFHGRRRLGVRRRGR